jgi:hypothetical protein
MNTHLSFQNQTLARSSKVISGDFSQSQGGGEEGVSVSAARICLGGIERPVLTVAGAAGIERRWMKAETAPRSGLIVGGERNGLVWPRQAYRVLSWEERALGFDGLDVVAWVRVKFEPLGRVFYAR